MRRYRGPPQTQSQRHRSPRPSQQPVQPPRLEGTSHVEAQLQQQKGKPPVLHRRHSLQITSWKCQHSELDSQEKAGYLPGVSVVTAHISCSLRNTAVGQ